MMALSTIASRRFEGALAIDMLVVPISPIRPRCSRRGPLASPSCVPWLLLGTRTRLGRICACFHRRLTLPSLVPSHLRGIRHRKGSSLVDVGSQRTDGRRLCAIDPRWAAVVPSVAAVRRLFSWLWSTWHSSLALDRTEPAPVLVHSLFHGRIPGSLLASFLPFPLGHRVPTATIPRVRFPSVHGSETSHTVLAISRARRWRGGGTSTFPFPPFIRMSVSVDVGPCSSRVHRRKGRAPNLGESKAVSFAWR